MTYKELLDKVAVVYSDDGLPEEGDTLAEFIRQELRDAEEGEVMDLDAAYRMMMTARRQLEAVAELIGDLYEAEADAQEVTL